MRIERAKRTKNNKRALLVVALLTLVLATATVYAYATKVGPFKREPSKSTPISQVENKVDYSAPTTPQTIAGTTAKEDSLSKQKSSENSQDPTSASIMITTASKNGNMVYVRTLINEVAPSSAMCQLNMTGAEGKKYSAEAGIQAMADSSTCQGFNIPFSSLSSGKWTIVVNYITPSGTKSTSKEIDL